MPDAIAEDVVVLEFCDDADVARHANFPQIDALHALDLQAGRTRISLQLRQRLVNAELILASELQKFFLESSRLREIAHNG